MRYKMTLTTDAEDLEGAVGNFQQLCSDLSTDPEDVETYVEEDPNGHVPAFTPISPVGTPKRHKLLSPEGNRPISSASFRHDSDSGK